MHNHLDLFDKFLHYLTHFRAFSEHTAKNYRFDLQKLAEFIENKKYSLNEFNKSDSRECLKYLQKYELSKRSQARFISSCRSFWTYLQREHAFLVNPWNQIRLPKLDKTLPHILSTEDMLSFLNNIDTSTPVGLRNRTICETLYGLGLRVSELCSLTLHRLDLSARKCIVMGKGNKERVLYFGDITATVLKTYLKSVRPVWATSDSSTLFINQKGAQLTSRTIQRIVKSCAEAQNVATYITPHTLRHNFASDLYRGGADLTVIKDLLGHSNIMTTEIYTHVSNEQLRETIQTCHPYGQMNGIDN